MNPPGSATLHDRVVAAMREVAGECIVPRFNKLRKEDIRTKTSATDMVTIADEEAEARLTPILRDAFPGSRVIGEESVAADPSLMAHLSDEHSVWVIDPIDGTANFVNGVARFATIIALIERGDTVMGWIHEPLTGKTLAAERGGGAWQTGVTGAVTPQSIPEPPAALSGMAASLYPKAFAKSLGRFAHNMRRGCAAHDYWALAEGRTQLLAYRKLKPWDHAAGVLIHTEAGGFNALLDGAPYRPTRPDQEWLLCAPNESLWHQVATMAER